MTQDWKTPQQRMEERVTRVTVSWLAVLLVLYRSRTPLTQVLALVLVVVVGVWSWRVGRAWLRLNRKLK